MEDYCYGDLRFDSESIYQAKVQLTDNNLIEKTNIYNPNQVIGYCETNIVSSHFYYPKLMFYFEELDLDCDKGHLEFYDEEFSDSRVEGNKFLVLFSYRLFLLV